MSDDKKAKKDADAIVAAARAEEIADDAEALTALARAQSDVVKKKS